MEKLILFFDTETTGFPKDGAPLEEQPHIVQLGYILAMYDGTKTEVIDQRNITINPGVPIPEEVSKIHGITDEIASSFQDFKSSAGDFFRNVIDAEMIVGHNVMFDYKMIKIEAERIWEDEAKRSAWLANMKSKCVCTMMPSVKLCQIPYPSGKAGYKWPKLIELHNFLFQKDFENAHDAYADIKATMDCFVELHKRNVITVI